MKARARIEFGIGNREYKAGDILEVTDEQARRLPDLLEPIPNEPIQKESTGDSAEGPGAPGKEASKALSGPPAHKMVTGGKNKRKK